MDNDNIEKLGYWFVTLVLIGFMMMFLSVAPANAGFFDWVADQQARYDEGLPQRSLEQYEAGEEPQRGETEMVHYGKGEEKIESAVIGTKEMDNLLNEGYTPKNGEFVTEDSTRESEEAMQKILDARREIADKLYVEYMRKEHDDGMAEMVQDALDGGNPPLVAIAPKKESTGLVGSVVSWIDSKTSGNNDTRVQQAEQEKAELESTWMQREQDVAKQLEQTTEELKEKWQQREYEISEVHQTGVKQGYEKGLNDAQNDMKGKLNFLMFFGGLTYLGLTWYKGRNPYGYYLLMKNGKSIAMIVVVLVLLSK